MHDYHRALALLVLLSGLTSCFPALPSDGGGQTEYRPPREVDPSDVALPDGYRIEAVARGLTNGISFLDCCTLLPKHT